MSKRLYIIVEGQTEQEFVKTVLLPYFQTRGIYNVQPILIHTSKSGKGGFVNYTHLKKDIKRLLTETSSRDIVVSTFVDFFRIPNNVPGWDLAVTKNSHSKQADTIQAAIGNDISDCRFVPYIQLHEFEALLFSNSRGFAEYFDEAQCQQTLKIIEEFPNPEDINNNPSTAPSKRLLKIKPNYQKVLEGNVIAIEVGINDMLKRCPRFAAWVNKLVEICGKN